MHRVPNRKYWYLAAGAVIALSAALVLPSLVYSYSVDSSQFIDGASDMSAFDPSRTVGVVADSQGGLRLQTDGATQTTVWTTKDDFLGKSAASVTETRVLDGLLTAEATATGSLKLRYLPLALEADPENPVLQSVAASTSPADSYEIQGPSVVKVSATDYRMYYTGVAADGYLQRIFEADSTDGITWTKAPGTGFGGCVLDVGEPGTFDEHGLVRPAVTYNASSTPPFRMWYGGLATDFGAIGYAESFDGHTWTKFVATSGEESGTPLPVVSPGVFGSADGYAVGEPSVSYNPATKDFFLFYVQYPSNDTKGRSVGVATSHDTTAAGFGSIWQKSGEVKISVTGNLNGGWFSPGAWYESNSPHHHMFFAGKKATGDTRYKLMPASTDDLTSWTPGNIVIGAGSTGAFDSNNVFWASVLPDPVGSLYRVYYTGSGGTGDVARSSLGYSEWSGSGGATAGVQKLTASSPGGRFDTMMSAQGAVWRNPATGELDMFYAGRSAADLKWRIGLATSTVDATGWAGVAGQADVTLESVLPIGAAPGFDAGGTESASVASLDGTPSVLAMAYHARSDTGVSSIAITTSTPTAIKLWSRATTSIITKGTGFDSADLAHPSLVTSPALRIYYAGQNGTGKWSIGVATSTAIAGSWTKYASAVVTAGPVGSIDENGASDPVVSYDASSTSYHMWYTAEDAQGIKRVAYATSTDGYNWIKGGLLVIPSGDPWAFDEKGVRAGSVWRQADGVWHLYYDGIDRGNAGNSAGNTEVNWRRIAHASGRTPGFAGNGQGTYTLTPLMTVDAPGYKYDIRDFTWDATAPAGTSMNLEISFFPGYQLQSGAWAQEWSPWAAVDGEVKPRLPLTTEKVRWRASLMREAGTTTSTPTLDEFRVQWAPTHFRTAGTAVSTTITPPARRYIESWTSLNVLTQTAANTTATATVIDMQGRTLIAPVVLTGGATAQTIDLAGVDPSVQQIRVKFDFLSDGHATPIIKNWNVKYVSTNRAPVELFQAFGRNQGVTLTWVEPDYEGMDSVRILRNAVGFPANPTDGTIVYEASATAGAFRSYEDTAVLVNGTNYYYTAYTRDTSGLWSPPAKSFAIPGPALKYLKATAGGGSVGLSWLNDQAQPISYRGVTIAKRESTPPVGPDFPTSSIVGRDLPAPLNVVQAKTDATVTPGAKTYYAAYIHHQTVVGTTIFDAYSMPATASVVPLWPTAGRFDARGFYSGGVYGAYVSGWVPASVPATCTVRIYKKLYSRATTSTGSGIVKVYDRVLARGQEITYTAKPLTALVPVWYTVFITAPTSEGVTVTSPAAYAAALPRSPRVAGFKVVPGDRRNTAYWTKPTYFYKIFTTPSAAVAAKAKYYCSGVRVVRRQGAKPYDVTDPLAKAVTSGAAYSTAVSASDLYLTNLQTYWYRGYLGVKVYDSYGYDYDYGMPSADVAAVPKYTASVSGTCSSYNKIVSPYYYYAYGRYIVLGGAVSPNHYKVWPSNTRGYVRTYVYVRKYNTRTRRYYYAYLTYRNIYLSSASTYRFTYRPARGYYMLRPYFPGDGNHLPRWGTARYVRVY